MPFVYNGIGTWYYGKRRVHSIKTSCEFCNRISTLQSYDTTLFFVVFFIPVIPLGQKRILNQCGVCQKHRLLSRQQWDALKNGECEAVLEQLQELQGTPEYNVAIVRAFAVAMRYQDEPLLDNLVDRLVEGEKPDALVQARLGDAYGFFSRWAEAETAYKRSLKAEEDEGVREQLAWAQIKQGETDEARKNLRHVIENRKAESLGMVYYLVEALQAQGRHDEALELMDERDEAFPDGAGHKEWQRQRKTSTRYRGRDKKVYSALLADRGAGYTEGNWTSKIPYLIAVLIPVLALAAYLGSAVWIGQSRKVYLVNGTNKPYAVFVQGAEQTLPANSVTPVHVPEGDVQVAFADPKLKAEPITAHIETNFWGRPFGGHTFVINPDESANVLEEEAFYAKANPRRPGAPTVHFGQGFYSLGGFDYEFENFPQTISVKNTQELRKTRVALDTAVSAESRLLQLQALPPADQARIGKRLAQLDPGNPLVVHWLSTRLPAQEMIDLLEPRLDERPVLVEWHRAYQTLMEKAHPETDLRPRYRKLLEADKTNPDLMYLLGRVDPDLDAMDKLYRKAAAASPPSAYALYGLGYLAMSEGRFEAAIQFFEKGLPLATEKTAFETYYHDALFAAGKYDVLLTKLQQAGHFPERKVRSLRQALRVYAARGQQDLAKQKIAETIVQLGAGGNLKFGDTLRSLYALYAGDVEGYLKSQDASSFAGEFLRRNYQKAAGLVQAEDHSAVECRGLLYLAASRARNSEAAAEAQWDELLQLLEAGGREERLFAEVLKGEKPLDVAAVSKQPIEPDKKRVLLLVLAQRNPAQAADLIKLAKKLDYQRDAVSLCLARLPSK